MILNNLNEQFTPNLTNKGKPLLSVWDAMDMDQYFKPEIVSKKKATDKLMEEVYPDLIPHINDTTLPFWIVPKIQKLGINGFQISACGGPGMTNFETGAMAYALARKDASIATFVLVHNSIGSCVVDALGDEE